jgi:hypothetical protein
LEVNVFVAAAEHLRHQIPHIVPDHRLVRMGAVVEGEADSSEHFAWVLWGSSEK